MCSNQDLAGLLARLRQDLRAGSEVRTYIETLGLRSSVLQKVMDVSSKLLSAQEARCIKPKVESISRVLLRDEEYWQSVALNTSTGPISVPADKVEQVCTLRQALKQDLKQAETHVLEAITLYVALNKSEVGGRLRLVWTLYSIRFAFADMAKQASALESTFTSLPQSAMTAFQSLASCMQRLRALMSTPAAFDACDESVLADLKIPVSSVGNLKVEAEGAIALSTEMMDGVLREDSHALEVDGRGVDEQLPALPGVCCHCVQCGQGEGGARGQGLGLVCQRLVRLLVAPRCCEDSPGGRRREVRDLARHGDQARADCLVSRSRVRFSRVGMQVHPLDLAELAEESARRQLEEPDLQVHEHRLAAEFDGLPGQGAQEVRQVQQNQVMSTFFSQRCRWTDAGGLRVCIV